MTLRKGMPPQGYETFPSGGSGAGTAASYTPSKTDSQKTISAAAEAQRLATQGSWGDNYLGGTPITNATPTASTVDETEDRYGDRRYPTEPPPMYTPTDTSPITPSSPNAARQQPEPVRRSSSPPSPSPPPVADPETNHEEDQPMPGTCTPSSPLLESGQSPHHYNHADWSRRRNKCKPNGCRCCRKACWFTFALIMCLWLMVPVLFDLGDKARTHMPRPTSDPLNESPIPTWPKPSREYRQHESSRSIEGTFQLYDLLDLSTSSGSISVTVNPQTGDKPAVLRLSSKSGSVTVRMGDGTWNGRGNHGELYRMSAPKQSISTNRTFDTTISSTAGSVSGNVLHGNGGKTVISAKSGMLSITIDTVGVGANDSVSMLETVTNSGSHRVVVRGEGSVKALRASHLVQGSGSLEVVYPAGWEGEVHAKSGGSGSVNVDGSGLEFQGGGRDVWARRGEGELLPVEVMGKGSGSVVFHC